MATATTDSSSAQEKPTAKRKSLSFVLLFAFTIAVGGYFVYNNSANSFINHNFYRVLYESSEQLNANLTKLTRMLENKGSSSSIRSQLPSFKELTKEQELAIPTTPEKTGLYLNIDHEEISLSPDKSQEPNDKFTDKNRYELKGDEIFIYRKNNTKPFASISVFDVLPIPKAGFSQYILADKNGNVLTSNGGEKTISFVNLDHISNKITEQKASFSFSNKKLETSTPDSALPSYSSHVDLTLSYGKFRVFVFPFKLLTQLNNGYFQSGDADNSTKTFESLYLIALLPKQKLSIAGTGHWNISLLIVMSASLLSMVAMLRLFLLPQNHSITRFFRYFVIGSSYVFFITIAAFLYAYVQNVALQNAKDDKANKYTKAIVNDLKDDIKKVFTGLDKHRSFYIKLLESTNDKTIKFPENKENLPTISNKYSIMAKAVLPVTSENNEITLHKEKITKSPKIDCRENKLTLVSNYDYPDERTLSFYSCSLEVISNKKEKSKDIKEKHLKNNDFEIETYLKSVQEKQDYFPDNILNILVVNKLAQSALPSIYYRENNALPKEINVSHRAYYKNVRDNKGYDLVLGNNTGKFNNVYIQRLRNIHNGSRGTTISMPLYNTAEYLKIEKDEGITYKTKEKSKSYVIAADVLLPSIDFGAPSINNDFTYMVVDRNNGKVLFHSNESRSMVENLFYSGDNQSSLAQWIKAGLDIDKDETKTVTISGHYHGQPGRFFIKSTVIPSWSVVVFYPNDSLDALMTSQFIYIFVIAIIIMCLFILFYITPKLFIQYFTKHNEKYLFPKAYNRNVFLILSIMICLGFGYHVINTLLGKINEPIISMTGFIILISLTLLTALLTYLYSYFTTNKPVKWNTSVHSSSFNKQSLFIRFYILIFVLLLVQMTFMSITANTPIKSLMAYYNKGYCHQINLEYQELEQKGLILFPNSITQHSFKANDIMKEVINDNANDIDGNGCINAYSEIKPGDFPTLSTLLGTQQFWQWINYYFSNKHDDQSHISDVQLSLKPFQGVIFGLFFILFLLGWIEFNRQILWRRLYCPTKMLQHIQNLTNSIKEICPDNHNEKLEINCQGIKLNGIGLTYLLNTQVILKPFDDSPFTENSPDFDIDRHTSDQSNFVQLFSVSAFLQTFTDDKRTLPNLKIDIQPNQTFSLLDVAIWDVEVCLDEPEHRQHLLALIMELKSLTLSKQINSFTIYAGFHSLQRVEMKNLLSIEYFSLLEHAEYLSWAECLMDFKMNIPKSFKKGIDQKILEEELAYFPELSYLKLKASSMSSHKEECEEKEMLFGDPLIPRSISEWSTMKYILLHAESLYRFKWELCTSAEKLALFNLAKRRGLNPENTKMIEHLALNGLIKVEDDHLALVNKSFAQFVLYAETNQTIAELERTGEHGVWKSYRVPIALLIILIIGGVAMTSGQSIYIISASLLGIITTIASVTNSANLLKNQLK